MTIILIRLPDSLPLLCQPQGKTEIEAKGFNNVIPVEDTVLWKEITITRTGGRHGVGEVLKLMGPASRFMFRAEYEPTVYWMGDTIWCEPVVNLIEQIQPDIIITHSCGAMWGHNVLIVMDAAQTLEVCRAAPNSVVIATHMDALDHATVSRETLREYAVTNGIQPGFLSLRTGKCFTFNKEHVTPKYNGIVLMMFLDPKKPVATCGSDSCNDCAIKGNLHCHFSLKDWVHFLFIALPPFLLGGAGINYLNGWFLVPWIIVAIVFFGFIEIRVMCSHCPHYAEPLTSLKCWANYGSPKLWKFRPGPMTILEKTIFFCGFVIVWGYPLPFLILSKQIFLLVVYSMTTIGFFVTLLNYMCSQCMNFACPLNRVDASVRNQFFDRNPIVAEAWGKIRK